MHPPSKPPSWARGLGGYSFDTQKIAAQQPRVSKRASRFVPGGAGGYGRVGAKAPPRSAAPATADTDLLRCDAVLFLPHRSVLPIAHHLPTHLIRAHRVVLPAHTSRPHTALLTTARRRRPAARRGRTRQRHPGMAPGWWCRAGASNDPWIGQPPIYQPPSTFLSRACTRAHHSAHLLASAARMAHTQLTRRANKQQLNT